MVYQIHLPVKIVPNEAPRWERHEDYCTKLTWSRPKTDTVVPPPTFKPPAASLPPMGDSL